MTKAKNMNVRKVSVWIFLFLIIVSIYSCRDIDILSTKNRRIIIVLIDYSASSSKNVLEKYIKIVNDDIFSNIGQYDYLAVMPIDEASKREPVKIIDEDLIEKKFSRKNDGFAHAQDSLQVRLDSFIANEKLKIAEVLRRQKEDRKLFTRHTDIVGALQQTSNLIEEDTKDDVKEKLLDFIVGKAKVTKENIIVLLSDMVHNSEDISFNSIHKLKEKQYASYLQQLTAQNKIPDLHECKVFVIGATSDNSNQLDRITDFWKSYFKTSKADLRAYGYNVEDKLRKYLNEKDN